MKNAKISGRKHVAARCKHISIAVMARVINAGANKSQGGVAGLPYDRVCGIATLIEKVSATDLACDEKRGEFIRATLRHDGVCERKGVRHYNVPHFES